jgi:hypothetical protein
MARPSIRQKELHSIAQDALVIMAREIQVYAALAMTAYDDALVVELVDDDPMAQTRLRMDAIGTCLSRIAEMSEALVKAQRTVNVREREIYAS